MRPLHRPLLRTALVCLCLTGGFARAQAPDSVATAAQSAVSFKLRAGDQIYLHFLREPSLSQTVTVDDRGDAAFPKVGIFNVGTMTVSQLRDSLRATYAQFLRAPEFEFAILRRVVVNGEVRAPNVYLVDPASTLRDVIARAGGITEYGAMKKVWIVRDGRRINPRGWETRGSASPDEVLQSGDQIYIGRKNWLQLNALSVISTGVLVASFLITILR